MSIDSPKAGHGRLPSGFHPGLTVLFRDPSAYRIGPWKPRQLAEMLQLALSCHAGYLAHTSLVDDSSFGDDGVPAIAHGLAKYRSTKRTKAWNSLIFVHLHKY